MPEIPKKIEKDRKPKGIKGVRCCALRGLGTRLTSSIHTWTERNTHLELLLNSNNESLNSDDFHLVSVSDI